MTWPNGAATLAVLIATFGYSSAVGQTNTVGANSARKTSGPPPALTVEAVEKSYKMKVGLDVRLTETGWSVEPASEKRGIWLKIGSSIVGFMNLDQNSLLSKLAQDRQQAC